MHHTSYRAFLQCVRDLLDTPEFKSWRPPPPPGGRSSNDPSVFVSFVPFGRPGGGGRAAGAAARAGLLHDLYLYDPRDKTQYQGNQCFAHPVAALKNAWALCGSLTPMEENIIVSHMWPLAKKMPRYKEALVVNLADKLCATAEVCRIYHYLRNRDRRRRRLAAA